VAELPSEPSEPAQVAGTLFPQIVLGVPAYPLGFGSAAWLEASERFFLLIGQRRALLEECATPVQGSIQWDQSALGGKPKGKPGWGAAGKTLGFGWLKGNGVVRVFAMSKRHKATLLPLCP
jgi:hypothetical protein